MKNSFINEIKKYSIPDLKLIIDTQQELYTTDEITIIKKHYEERKAEYISKHAPKQIPCVKCDARNDFYSSACTYCGHPINNKPYLNKIQNKMLGIMTSEDMNDYADDTHDRSSFLLQYVISFIIPLVGFIMGGILIVNDDNDKKYSGKICLIISALSLAISAIIYIVWRK